MIKEMCDHTKGIITRCTNVQGQRRRWPTTKKEQKDKVKLEVIKVIIRSSKS
jgi:hypothetical protein